MLQSKSRTLLILAAAVFAIAVLIWPRSSTDEHIRDMLGELAAHGTFEGKIHPIALAKLSTDVSQRFFGEQVRFEITYQGEPFTRDFSRNELARQITAGRQIMAQFAARFESIKVIPRDSTDHATATFELRAMGRAVGASNADYFLEIFAVTAELKREEDGEWRIIAADVQDLRNTHEQN